jgi:hypothetical protein
MRKAQCHSTPNQTPALRSCCRCPCPPRGGHLALARALARLLRVERVLALPFTRRRSLRFDGAVLAAEAARAARR